jgi:hypothetical protein
MTSKCRCGGNGNRSIAGLTTAPVRCERKGFFGPNVAGNRRPCAILPGLLRADGGFVTPLGGAVVEQHAGAALPSSPAVQ